MPVVQRQGGEPLPELAIAKYQQRPATVLLNMHLRYFSHVTGVAEPPFPYFEGAIDPWWNQLTQPSGGERRVVSQRAPGLRLIHGLLTAPCLP